MDAARAETYNPELLANQRCAKSKRPNKIGFIGLGAMGFGMATHLLKSNFCVQGYDVTLLSSAVLRLMRKNDVTSVHDIISTGV